MDSNIQDFFNKLDQPEKENSVFGLDIVKEEVAKATKEMNEFAKKAVLTDEDINKQLMSASEGDDNRRNNNKKSNQSSTQNKEFTQNSFYIQEANGTIQIQQENDTSSRNKRDTDKTYSAASNLSANTSTIENSRNVTKYYNSLDNKNKEDYLYSVAREIIDEAKPESNLTVNTDVVELNETELNKYSGHVDKIMRQVEDNMRAGRHKGNLEENKAIVDAHFMNDDDGNGSVNATGEDGNATVNATN